MGCRTDESIPGQAARRMSGLRVPVIHNGIVHAAYECYVFVDPRS